MHYGIYSGFVHTVPQTLTHCAVLHYITLPAQYKLLTHMVAID